MIEEAAVVASALGLVTPRTLQSRSQCGDATLPLNGRCGMAGNTSAAGRTVTSRVLGLLGGFDADHRRLTLTELAGRADLLAATAHRLLRELVAWGALVRRESGGYVVGRRIWDLGLLAPVQTGLRQVAAPFLHDIYAATLATVHLAVREGLEVSTSTGFQVVARCRSSAGSALGCPRTPLRSARSSLPMHRTTCRRRR